MNKISSYTFKHLVVIGVITLFSCIVESCQTKNTQPDGMVLIPAATFEMGGDNSQARLDEFPKHKVEVAAFWMDETEVTNAQFKMFVDATNYITTAEKDFEYVDEKGNKIKQKAGALVFHSLNKNENANPNTWWQFIEGANWKHPQGPTSSIDGKDDFPVVQISWEDAMAYCKWSGKRLPTEAEWELAARGGFKKMLYAWGNQAVDEGKPKCNSWEGDFPYYNSLQDGYNKAAPVKSFAPNQYGLYDMAGNVWEWCSDWYAENYYAKCVENHIFKNPENTIPNEFKEKVIRGGSFLCHNSYCSGFRVAARMKTTFDTGLEHTGFRCVKDIK